MMNFTYYLLIITLLLSPILGYVLSKLYAKQWFITFIKTVCIILLIHNIFYFFKYSVVGDYFDYSIFAFEYLVVCVWTALIRKTGIHLFIKRSISVIGNAVEIAGLFLGLAGILFFIPISMDYEAKKIFTFQQNSNYYNVREYVFGFATLENSRYTFETYQMFQPFPFEKRIDITTFLDTETKLKLGDDSMLFSLTKVNHKQFLTIMSSDGEQYLKEIN